MKNTTKPPSKEQSVPPFDSRVAVIRPRPSTMAGSFVARKYRIDPTVADLVANPAGRGKGS
jgi:hypothetical protein